MDRKEKEKRKDEIKDKEKTIIPSTTLTLRTITLFPSASE